jgi:ABC-type nitrate/sulfonate/bicarbonate transport system ATPase subunit
MKIESNNLVFSYTRDSIVLDNISFSVDNGNTIAIVGLSGCGKSTLLRLIAGLITKNRENIYKGEIKIEGLTPFDYKLKNETGFMFQNAALFPNLKVRKNIEIALKIKGISDSAKVDEMVQKVGLTNHIHKYPKNLSGGMQTRVALARTFITNPKLMLLDEPFSGLDVSNKSELLVELERLKKEYSTNIVFVTHDIDEALLISNHIIVLSLSGKIIDEIFINQFLPRAFDNKSLKNIRKTLFAEYEKIYDLIMEDQEKYGKNVQKN